MPMDYMNRESPEIKSLFSRLRILEQVLKEVTEKFRPSINDERYLTSEEVCQYLHISLRTLQTLRNTRQIPFTIVGERTILYPESGIRDTLMQNYREVRKL